MSIWATLSAPFTAVINGISGFVGRKQAASAAKEKRADELKEARHQAQVERVKRGDETERDYDRIAQENARTSIIDEVMIFWVLGIVTCLFIPQLAPFAVAGFKALAGVPVYFQLIFVGCFISKLGLRFLFSGRTLFGKVLGK